MVWALKTLHALCKATCQDVLCMCSAGHASRVVGGGRDVVRGCFDSH